MSLKIEVKTKPQWQQQKIILHLAPLSVLLTTRLHYCQQAEETLKSLQMYLHNYEFQNSIFLQKEITSTADVFQWHGIKKT